MNCSIRWLCCERDIITNFSPLSIATTHKQHIYLSEVDLVLRFELKNFCATEKFCF